MEDRNGGSMFVTCITNFIFIIGLLVLLGSCVPIFSH
jgi:hypothetical protein